MMMFLPTPLLVSATVNLALAPLRRLRLLMAVEDDLAEEGVVPSNTGAKARAAGSSGKPRNTGGFGGAIEAARFLYGIGGVSAFYRGAALEYAGVVIKYLIQVTVVMPICRRVPLQMQHSYALTTLLHTVVLFFPIAPVQVLIDTVIVNACTDFVRKEDERESGGAATAQVTEVDGSKFRFRFGSLWEAAKAAWQSLPIIPLANKLMLLDFAGRYVSSLFFNKVIGFFYDHLLGDDGVSASNGRTLRILMRVVPPLVSICYGLLTYPVVSLPFSHFVRVRLHERDAAERQRAKEEERDYVRPADANGEKGFQGRHSIRLSSYPRPEDREEKLLVDRIVELLCHWDVRDYLYFTFEQWGLRGLYRGYSMQIATIALGVGGGAVVSEVLTHLRRGFRHAVQSTPTAP